MKSAARAMLVVAALTTPCTTPIPNDGVGATLSRFENTRGTRYTEVFFIGGTPIIREVEANIYNTYGLNDMERTGDSSPDAMLAQVDVEEQETLFGAIGILLDGPRLWTLDWVEMPRGVVRNFGGLRAAWVGRVDLSGVNLEEPGATAYKPTTIERRTELGFEEGRLVFLLDDPQGRTWVMTSAGLIVDPTQRLEELGYLGNRLKLARGWTFRVQVLAQDLRLRAEQGVAGVVHDELGNAYDQTGPGYSNLKP